MTLTQRRPHTESKERLSFETLLSDVSARFVNVPSEKLDAEIVDAQRRICDCLGLDASSLWQSEVDNPGVHVLTHAFRPLQGPPIPERMDAQEYFPWCRQQLLAGKVIIVSSLEKLPVEAARDIESWRYFGVKTSLTFPLSAGGEPSFGSLSFNDLRRERLWPTAIVNRLQLLAQIFASALARRRADEASRDKEERFRGLAETALVGFYVLENGRYTYVNPAMARVFGYSVAEMTGMTPREIVQPCDHAMVAENIRRRVAGEVRAMQYEVRGRHKDGSTRDVEVYGATVLTKRGPALVGTLIDITERKRAQDALKESETRFKQVIENVADFIWEVDANGLYTYASPSVERILGYTSDELIGKTHFYDLFVPEDREELRAAAFRLFDESGPFRAFPNRNVAKNGRIIDLETTGAPIVNDAGELIGYRGADRDVTERRRAEMALRESEALNRSIFEQAAVGIAQVGLEGRWLQVNDKVCEILGYSREELMQLTFQDVTYPEDLTASLDFVQRVLSGEIKTYTTEKRYVRKDGSLIWANLTVALVRNESPRYFISVVEDITARKQVEAELRLLSGRLITAQEKERAWLAKELHDGLSQDLALLAIELDQLGNHPPEQPKHVSVRVEKLSTRVKELAEDVHKLSHGLHPSILESVGLVAALKSFFRELERSRKVTIHFTARDVPQMLPNEVALGLYRVAQEALQNVVKHSGAKQATAEIMLAGDELRMRIADDGKGFDLCSNNSPDTVGLIGMRERIELLDGEIRWETKPGQGTTVHVSVPI